MHACIHVNTGSWLDVIECMMHALSEGRTRRKAQMTPPSRRTNMIDLFLHAFVLKITHPFLLCIVLDMHSHQHCLPSLLVALFENMINEPIIIIPLI